MTPRGRGSVRGFVRAVFPYSLAPHGSESVRVVCLARGSRTGWFPVRLGAAQERVRTFCVSRGSCSRTGWFPVRLGAAQKRFRTGCVSNGNRPARGGLSYGLAPHRNDSARVASLPYGWVPARIGAAQTRFRTGCVSHGRLYGLDSCTAWCAQRRFRTGCVSYGLDPVQVVFSNICVPCGRPLALRKGQQMACEWPSRACTWHSEGLPWTFERPAKRALEGPQEACGRPAECALRTCKAHKKDLCARSAELPLRRPDAPDLPKFWGSTFETAFFFRKSAMQNALSAFQRLSWLLCAVINSELIRSGRVEMH